MHFLQLGARPALTQVKSILEPNALSLHCFLNKFVYQRHNISQSPVRFAKTVTADMLVHCVLEDPRTPFSLLLRQSLNIHTEMLDSVKSALCAQILNNVQVFPHKLIFSTQENIYTWMTITSVPLDKHLIKQAQQSLKTIRSRVNKLIPSRKPIKPQRVMPLSLKQKPQIKPEPEPEPQPQPQQQQRINEEEVCTRQVVRAIVHAVENEEQQKSLTSANIRFRHPSPLPLLKKT